jgi:hypothetical protein
MQRACLRFSFEILNRLLIVENLKLHCNAQMKNELIRF